MPSAEYMSDPAAFTAWLVARSSKVLFVGSLTTMHWTKRARGPTGRAFHTTTPMLTVTTLVAVDDLGAHVHVETGDSLDFAKFLNNAVHQQAAKTGADSSLIALVGDKRHLAPEHITAIADFSHHHWILEAQDATLSAVHGVIENFRGALAGHTLATDTTMTAESLCAIVTSSIGK